MDSDLVTAQTNALRGPDGWRGRVRHTVRHGLLSLGGKLTSFDQTPFLRCLYCHHVFENQRDRFRSLLRRLSQHGTWIGLDHCLDILEGSSPLDGRYFHLSFDDGLKNTFENAVPILEELEIPATFFLPTALIGADPSAARYYSREVLEYDRTLEFMTWNDVRTLNNHGFDVGAHTRHHVRLSEISDSNRLDREIRGAKDDVEEALDVPCQAMSWPYGTDDDVHLPSRRLFRRAGYRAVFGAFRGSIAPEATNPFRIPRHHFEVEWPWTHIRFFASGQFE